ncbi:MAG: redoxin domain-containing protein [Cellvibrio sp.]|uniref:TlpA family protein disulfide reductase n=1 Tax=Cellvibrio sp. TaxID=1965322 RepID=UPI0031A32740
MLIFRWYLLLLAFASIGLQANPLQLDEQYAVFDGQPVNLKEVIGHKPVYIKFWATWCLDCRKELPSLQKTYEQYRDTIAIYAVNLNINETDEYIRTLQQKHKLSIPIVMDNNGSIASNFQFHGTPFHVLINAQGEVVYTTYKDDAALQQQLQQLANPGKNITTLTKTITQEKQTAAIPSTGLSLVYFSATWCDWYMKDIHPEMTPNCLGAIKLVNSLHQQLPQLSLQAYVTHLWTEQKDVDDYVKKFSIVYPVNIDSDNRIAQHYRSNEYPTLLVINNGKEINRFTKFDSPAEITKTITTLATKK